MGRPVCDFPWRYAFVSTSGRLSHCCSVVPRTEISGVTSFDEYWNSDYMKHVRSLFLAGKYLEAGCPATCPTLLAQFPSLSSHINVRGQYDSAARTGSNYLDSLPASVFDPPATKDENKRLIKKEVAEDFCEVKSRPMRAHIEINSACNLKCQMCDVGVGESSRTNPRFFIDDQNLEKMKVFYPNLEYIEIQGGEVFFYTVDKAPLTKLLKDLSENAPKDVQVLITTNALALNERWVDFLLDRDIVSHLSVSIDTVDPDAYERQRLGGRLSVVLKNLDYLTEQKAKRRREKPGIVFTSVLNSITYPNLLALQDLAARHGASSVWFHFMAPTGSPEFIKETQIFVASRKPDLVALRGLLERFEYPSNRKTVLGAIDQLLAQAA